MLDMPPPPPTPVPVNEQCIIEAAEYQKIPTAILALIMMTEDGAVGMENKNKNGTRDYGPMQINSCWLPKLREAGITEYMLKYDGPTNIAAGAYVFRLRANDLERRTPRSQRLTVWDYFAHYHSGTPNKKTRYLKLAMQKMQKLKKITLRKIAKRANRLLVRKNSE
jgi:hypothetical protein